MCFKVRKKFRSTSKQEWSMLAGRGAKIRLLALSCQRKPARLLARELPSLHSANPRYWLGPRGVSDEKNPS